jgi:DNA-binding NtrC family response regulator
MDSPKVAVVNADPKQCREMCSMLERLDYPATALHSLEALHSHLGQNPVKVVIVDLDNISVNNSFFRALKRRYPNIYLLAVSSLSHHPGLEEALGSHIYACLAKPLDPEELHYCLKGIAANFGGSGEAQNA